MIKKRVNTKGLKEFPKKPEKPVRVMTQDDYDKLQEHNDKQIDRMTTILVALVVVLLIGFVTLIFMVAAMLIDEWRFHSSIYEKYMEQTNTK